LTANADGRAEVVSGQAVSGNYYAGLGVDALVGRTLTDEDDHPSASPVAVLSYRYWQKRFNGDASVIGKTLNLNNVAFTIIGVTPQGFEGTEDAGSTQDVTIAIAWEPQIYLERNRSQLSADVWWLRVMGRLKPGVMREAGRAELENIFQQSVIEHRAARQARALATGGNRISDLEPQQLPRLYLDPGGQGQMGTRRYYAPSLYMLLGVVGLVLLIACANVANLLLARASSRQKEIGVRLALGAGRFRLMRQLLAESVLLSSLGGLMGIIFAIWLKDGLLAVSDWGGRSMQALEPRLDWRVLGFTLALSVLTGLVFGLAPAWRSTRVDLTPALKDSGRRSNGVSRSRLSRGLVVVQVALSLVLLTGAGLFLRTLTNLHEVEPGFNQRNLLLFGITPGFIGYKDEKLTQLYQQLAERIENLPGVEAITFSTNTLLANGSSSRNVFLREALAAPPDAEGRITPNGTGYVNHVRENFLETMGIPMHAGRGLRPQDNARSPKVVVVNQTFANAYFPGENPIGKRFTFDPKKPDEIEIVGLARDAKYTRQRDEIPPTAYIPWQQELGWMIGVTVEVRTTGEPTALVAGLREAARDVEPNLPLNNIRTQVEQADQTLAMERLLAKLVTLFALLAQLLAAIGLFGVLAYAVSQRTREIGIRLALGADHRNVLGMILRQGLSLALAGVVLGLVVAYGLTKFLETQVDFNGLLYGVQANDTVTYGITSAVLLLVAMVACLVPARRAARVDPMQALRSE
jgi:predicted permease